MLRLKIKETNEIDPTGKLVYLTDDTGAYNSSTNPTGYGGINPARNTLAVFPIGYLVDSKGGKSPLEFTVFNPTTATEFHAIIPKDGYLQFQLVSIPVVDTSDLSQFDVGQQVFSSNDFKLYKIGADNLGNNILIVIKPTELLSLPSTSLIFDELFIANLSLTKIEVNKEIVDLMINSENLSNEVKIDYLNKQYNTLRTIIQSAVYQFCIGNKFEAARQIEFLITNNYGKLQ